jgi:predicted  nucleic acid-binding Zn-ribbon protein
MRRLTLLAVALTLIACDRSKPELEKTLAQVQQISAEKDTLLKEVTATSQFIAEINSEIAKVRNANTGKPTNVQPGDVADNSTPSQRRAVVLDKVKELAARLNATEGRLAASRKRVVEMAGNDSSMKVQLAAYDSTIASFRTIMDNQKAEIANLTTQVNSLTSENTQLKTEAVQLVSEKTQLTGEKDQLTTERNTVYYVVGTKEELLKRHIIEQTGGMLGLGKTQVPARELNPSDFTTIDKTKVAEIPFPKANTPYKIVTRQAAAALESTPDEHGRIMGSIKIKDPDTFWAASKYLIVIEQ